MDDVLELAGEQRVATRRASYFAAWSLRNTSGANEHDLLQLQVMLARDHSCDRAGKLFRGQTGQIAGVWKAQLLGILAGLTGAVAGLRMKRTSRRHNGSKCEGGRGHAIETK